MSQESDTALDVNSIISSLTDLRMKDNEKNRIITMLSNDREKLRHDNNELMNKVKELESRSTPPAQKTNQEDVESIITKYELEKKESNDKIIELEKKNEDLLNENGQFEFYKIQNENLQSQLNELQSKYDELKQYAPSSETNEGSNNKQNTEHDAELVTEQIIEEYKSQNASLRNEVNELHKQLEELQHKYDVLNSQSTLSKSFPPSENKNDNESTEVSTNLLHIVDGIGSSLEKLHNTIDELNKII